MAELIRCYGVIAINVSRNNAQWLALRNQAYTKPMLNAIITEGSKWNLPQMGIIDSRRSFDGKIQLIRFIIDDRDQSTLLNTLNAQCATRNIIQVTTRSKFQALIEQEIKESALDIGYTILQVSNLNFIVVGYGDRDTAITEAENNIQSAKANWESVA